jgi:hypothetical protein
MSPAVAIGILIRGARVFNWESAWKICDNGSSLSLVITTEMIIVQDCRVNCWTFWKISSLDGASTKPKLGVLI